VDKHCHELKTARSKKKTFGMSSLDKAMEVLQSFFCGKSRADDEAHDSNSLTSSNSRCDVKKQTPLLSNETPPFYDSDGAFVSNIKSGNKFLKFDEETFSFKLTDPQR
jgi:hypothetical protein